MQSMYASSTATVPADVLAWRKSRSFAALRMISFYVAPSKFAAMGESAGLKLVRGWPPDDWHGNRYSYLFRKV